MNELRERNQQVLQMLQAGASYRETAQRSGVTMQRVHAIVQEFEAEKSFLQRSCRLLEEIRRTDDVDRKWAVADLVDALRFTKMTRTALVHHFKWSQTKEISFRDLMNLAVSEKSDAREGYVITPLLDVRCVGVKGFWSVVNQLTNLDLGKRCNEEWRKRLERLKRGWRIKGARSHSWSKPIEPRPEWTASTESASQATCEETSRVDKPRDQKRKAAK